MPEAKARPSPLGLRMCVLVPSPGTGEAVYDCARIRNPAGGPNAADSCCSVTAFRLSATNENAVRLSMPT